MKYFWLLPVLAAGMAFLPVAAGAQEADTRLSPRKTEIALNALMKANNASVKCGSTTMTVGELLAMHLSHFNKGENQVMGLCEGANCEVALVRANGSSKSSSLTLKYAVKGNAADPATIRCMGTP